jgi:hypothetical protein
MKYIEDEGIQKRRLLKENELLQKELEHKSKLKDEELKTYLEEKERARVIELKAQLEIDKAEMEYLIVKNWPMCRMYCGRPRNA